MLDQSCEQASNMSIEIQGANFVVLNMSILGTTKLVVVSHL